MSQHCVVTEEGEFWVDDPPVTPHEAMLRQESHLLRVDRDEWRSVANALAEALRDARMLLETGPDMLPNDPDTLGGEIVAALSRHDTLRAK